jgi:nickel-dependent lactate racemase
MSEQDMKALEDVPLLFAELAATSALAAFDTRLLVPREPEQIDLVAATKEAMKRPVGSPKLEQLAVGKRSAVIVTSDATRSVPNKALLPLVVASLRTGGIAEDQITVIIALGAHRSLDEREKADLLGEWASRLNVVNHDPHGECVSVGTTSAGHELRLSRSFCDAELRVALGLVEPHEFAGFTGGGKSILPGIAAYDSIVRNHSLEMLRQPGARPGALAGNQIREEMDEAARLSGLHFILNVVLDSRQVPLAVAAGDPVEAHRVLVDFVDGYARVQPPRDIELSDEAPDLIVTGPGQPLDINLYQSVKPLVALESWVGEATRVVLLSRCWDGNGSRQMIEPFRSGGGPRQVMERLAKAYTIEKDHSYFISRFLSHCPNVVACCPGVEAEDLEAVGFTASARVDEAVSIASASAMHSSRRTRPLAIFIPSPQRFLLAQWREASGNGIRLPNTN